MSMFSRYTTEELQVEAKQAQVNVESAARMQSAFGATATSGEDNALAMYRQDRDRINEELKRRS